MNKTDYGENVNLVITDVLRQTAPGIGLPDTVNETWLMSHGACRDTDPDVFFGPTGSSSYDNVVEPPAFKKRRVAEAKFICNTCPVKTICLEHSLANMETVYSIGRFGIRGGMTERQRTTVYRSRQRYEAQEYSRRHHPSSGYLPQYETENPPTSE